MARRRVTGNRHSLGGRCFGEADGRGRTTQQPPGSDQQVHGILEKGGSISLDGVANELKNPTNDKQGERPTPVKDKQRQRNHNHGNADAVRQLVQRMLMLGFIVFDKGFGHFIYLMSEGKPTFPT